MDKLLLPSPALSLHIPSSMFPVADEMLVPGA